MEQPQANDLPRVLLENYVMLSAAVENQNWGRLQDMMQLQQRVHQHLLQIVQHIEDAPAVAMTLSSPEPPAAAQAGPGQPTHPVRQQPEPQQPGPPVAAWWSDGIGQSAEGLLRGIGLSEFVPLLQRERVDLAALQLMQERHMRELGLPLGAVVKIRAALAATQEQQQQAVAATQAEEQDGTARVAAAAAAGGPSSSAGAGRS